MQTIVDGGMIRADAMQIGDGGSVVLWSDGATSFTGEISAQAFGERGNGGDAEVSGLQTLDYRGRTDLRANAGRIWHIAARSSQHHHLKRREQRTYRLYSKRRQLQQLTSQTLQNALATANVTVSTGSTGSQAGDITIVDAVTWSSGTLLTLNAAGSINVNANITATGGSFSAIAGIRSMSTGPRSLPIVATSRWMHRWPPRWCGGS